MGVLYWHFWEQCACWYDISFVRCHDSYSIIVWKWLGVFQSEDWWFESPSCLMFFQYIRNTHFCMVPGQ